MRALPNRREWLDGCVGVVEAAVQLNEGAQERERALLKVHAEGPMPGHNAPETHRRNLLTQYYGTEEWTQLQLSVYLSIIRLYVFQCFLSS